MPIFDLTVSFVLYHTDIEEIDHVIKLIRSSPLKIRIFLVDNSSEDNLKQVGARYDNVEYIFNNANIGYGAGHNIAINRAKDLSKYHLVMNADIDFDPSILEKSLRYIDSDDTIGMVSPLIRQPDGRMQYFCRLLPTPFDLIARRFLPEFVQNMFERRMNEYLLFDKDYSKKMNIPNLPGCFMLIRMTDLLKVGGFDEKFFMYVEDIDLTRRLFKISKTMYYPEIEIVHALGRGSYFNSKLMVYHIKSAVHYFNKWGWFYDKERTLINNKIKTY